MNEKIMNDEKKEQERQTCPTIYFLIFVVL